MTRKTLSDLCAALAVSALLSLPLLLDWLRRP